MTEQTRAALRAARQNRVAHWLTPAFRRWAFGVSAAGVAAAIYFGWLPEGSAVVIVPLLMALFFVNDNGDPR